MSGSSPCVSDRHDDGKTTSMVRKGCNGERENSDETESVALEPAIIIEGNKCKQCSNEVDLRKEAVQCFKCCKHFHGICYKDSRDISSPSALSGHLAPALTKSGTYENRFGHFLFLA